MAGSIELMHAPMWWTCVADERLDMDDAPILMRDRRPQDHRAII